MTLEGEHVFSYRAFGPTGSFICTWAIIFGYVSVVCFEVCAFPTIIGYIWPGFLKGYMYTVEGFDVYASWVAVGIGMSLLMTLINVCGIKAAAIFQSILTVAIAAVGIILLASSVVTGDLKNVSSQAFVGESGVDVVKTTLAIAMGSPFYFIGFDVIPQAAEEIKTGLKKVGRILLLSIILAVLFYAFMIFAVGYEMTPDEITTAMQGNGLVAADAIAKAFNSKTMADVLIIGGICGILTSWNAFLVGGSRALYSMAESYMVPRVFAKLHPKHKTPVTALYLIGGLSVLSAFAGRSMLVWISTAGNFGCVLAYLMVSLSFLVLRKKEPEMVRPYKVKHAKTVGTIAVILSGFMLVMYIVPGSGSTLTGIEWALTGAWFALGFVFYIICKKKYGVKFGSMTEIISDEEAMALQKNDDEIKAAIDKAVDEAIENVVSEKSNSI